MCFEQELKLAYFSSEKVGGIREGGGHTDLSVALSVCFVCCIIKPRPEHHT